MLLTNNSEYDSNWAEFITKSSATKNSTVRLRIT